MSKPTFLEVIDMTGRILYVGDEAVGLIGGMSRNTDRRPGIVRIAVNCEIRSTDMVCIDLDCPEKKQSFTVYETAKIEKRHIEIVYPPLLIPPCYYYDVQIKGD